MRREGAADKRAEPRQTVVRSERMTRWRALKRGEIWTAAAGTGYASEPRPVAIVQDDRFDATGSVTICAFTTDPTEAPLFRLAIEPNDVNGLREPCSLMVDKITTIRRTRLGEHVGRLSDEEMVRLGRAIPVFCGLAG